MMLMNPIERAVPGKLYLIRAFASSYRHPLELNSVGSVKIDPRDSGITQYLVDTPAISLATRLDIERWDWVLCMVRGQLRWVKLKELREPLDEEMEMT